MDAGLCESLCDFVAQLFEHPTRLHQVALDLAAPLKRPHGGILDRGAGRRVRLTGHGGHRIEQPVQLSWESECSQPPTAGAAPLAQAARDNGPLRVEAGQRQVQPVVVQFAVDFVAE